MLSIATRLLTPGSGYRLQVDYDGGQTGILSFTYADEIVLEGYHEGDRDGGDAGGNPPDTIIQPPPEDTDDQDDGFADRPSTKPSKPPATNDGGTDSDESIDYTGKVECAIVICKRSARGRYRFDSSPLKCRRLSALQSLPLPILPGSFQKTGKIQCKAL